jgi:hypothetical protein
MGKYEIIPKSDIRFPERNISKAGYKSGAYGCGNLSLYRRYSAWFFSEIHGFTLQVHKFNQFDHPS